MNIADIINRKIPVEPWECGEKIPWNEPGFSKRMLDNHLSQEHDWASRRMDIIRGHVLQISQILQHKTSHILDLACGPGLYSHLLAELGHTCVGVDFSPASIAYARERAEQDHLEVEYVLGDIRDYQADPEFDCVLLTFGELNVFRAEDARAILLNSAGALRDGGRLVLEAHTLEAVRAAGKAASSWYSCESGLFSDNPHLCLSEHSWDESRSCASTRYFVIDAQKGDTREFCSSMRGYSLLQYEEMLQSAGFGETHMLSPEEWRAGDDFEGKLQAFACQKLGSDKD